MINSLVTGFIYRSDNYGITWALATTQPSALIWQSVSLSGSGQYQTAVSSNIFIYRSTDYGITWTSVTSSGNRNWRSVSISTDGQYQTAVVSAGFIYRSNDYGFSWEQTAASRSWQSVSLSATGQYQTAVVATSGSIYTSTDWGFSWAIAPTQPSSTNWISVSLSASGQYQTAVVSAGFIYTSTDYGATWALATTQPTAQTWRSVSISGSGLFALDVNGDVRAWSFTSTSDYRIKDNVRPITSTIDELQPRSYFNKLTHKEDMGFIAHELQEHFPFLVNGEKDGENYQSVNYMGLIGLLVKEIQDLKKEVKEIKSNMRFSLGHLHR